MSPATNHYLDVQRWEDERKERVSAYAEVLVHLDSALAALPAQDAEGRRFSEDVTWNRDHVIGRLRAILNEDNPYSAARGGAS